MFLAGFAYTRGSGLQYVAHNLQFVASVFGTSLGNAWSGDGHLELSQHAFVFIMDGISCFREFYWAVKCLEEEVAGAVVELVLACEKFNKMKTSPKRRWTCEEEHLWRPIL